MQCSILKITKTIITILSGVCFYMSFFVINVECICYHSEAEISRRAINGLWIKFVISLFPALLSIK